MSGRKRDAVDGYEVAEEVCRSGSGDDVHLVVVPGKAALVVEVQRLPRAVAREIVRPFDSQSAENLAVVAPG